MNIDKVLEEIKYLAGEESGLTCDLSWEDFDNGDIEDWVTLVDIVSKHVGNVDEASDEELQMLSLATGFTIQELKSGEMD